MFCASCGYELKDLPEPRCPECGREFDPGNPRTFREVPLRRFSGRDVRHLCIFQWILAAFSFGLASPVLSYWAAWLVLGRQPRYPQDELAYVPYVGWLAWVCPFAMMLAPIALMFGMVLPIVVGARAYPARGFWWGVLRACLPPVLFILSIMLLGHVPAATGDFFMD